jgi:3-phenylpropionate/trans-cinnamate dioxygenase ferredoxin component
MRRQEKLMAEFVTICPLAELGNGECKTVQVNGNSIAIYNVDGKVFATDNTCLHRGGGLGEGFLNGEVVSCPWHMWEWNVRTGENLEDPSLKLRTYPVRVDGDAIKIEL